MSAYTSSSMKKNISSNMPVTEEKLKKILKNYPTKWDMDKRFDEQDRRWDERFVQLKSDIFTKFDELMGELAQQREDRLFTDHDVKVLKDKSDEQDKRLKKLETS